MENPGHETNEAPARPIADVLRQGAQRLFAAGIESGRLDAEVLLGHVLRKSREQLVLAANEPMTRAEVHVYEQLLVRRLERAPVAYITGTREFWSLDFYLTPDVLIPRPETERLVEIVLGRARDLGYGGPLRVADLGTGSGAIAVALAREFPEAQIWAVDVSAAALAVARRNAAKHGVAERINFIQGDLLDAIGARADLHLIVSNPPYIPGAEIAALEPEVSRWEPRAALDGGPDGLDYYRRIAAETLEHLIPGGAVAVEIDARMGRKVMALFECSGDWSDIAVYQDYAGNDRVVVARRAP